MIAARAVVAGARSWPDYDVSPHNAGDAAGQLYARPSSIRLIDQLRRDASPSPISRHALIRERRDGVDDQNNSPTA